MQLNETSIGDKVRISELKLENSMLKRRLLALGCDEGCEICIKQKGLFGGPYTFETKGQYISIRQCDACAIVVERR
ncbi:FeoA family protein [Listeria ivanovii]|uniref:Ferrous iron transport protein A n=2 Tax=Listeria ivanovii TaxID=1638 RepID=A0ABS1G6Y4_LISIV|nr:ferrous iron transport protein A [Listeria ivanovii]EFR96188.1 ferrous iron transport protein A [Listeria ivanovii FSL F6-596]AIS60510.1 iron transporter FeoA [Listeria ivanovii subsp. londoniensis]AIS63337.1 iron transporter FeoA [Listeria ivanovii subsp. londoniensis]MBC2255862.1 ferrous iron transport protein A [Listeria ivanovii]MBK1962633.1 ferrous iron transport protein A [Listeria ivanovii subsp. londoniensis]